MSATPPDPGVPSSLPTDFAACSYDATTHALRDATGAPVCLVVASDTGAAPTATRWALEGTRTRCPVALLSSDTYALVCAGVVAGGLLVSGGTTYHLRAVRHPGDGNVWMEPTTT